MQTSTINLRLVFSERDFEGGEQSREHAITVFLAELRVVLTEAVIEALDKELLGDMFENWLIVGLDYPQVTRIDMFRRSLSLSHCPWLSTRPATTTIASADNVVSLRE